METLNREGFGLSVLHSVFLKACIKTKMYKFALSVVNSIPCEMKEAARNH